MEISYDDDRILSQIEGSAAWSELPASEAVEALLYGASVEREGRVIEAGPYIAENGTPLFPQVENGYWFFRDRHGEALDPADDSEVLGRASLNVTVAVYDADSRTLYYGELDT